VKTSTDAEFKETMSAMDEGYNELLDLMTAMDNMMKQSSNNAGEVTVPTQTVTSYVNSSQQNYNGFVSFKNNVITFLNTYKANEKSQKLALDIQEQNLAITKLNLEKADSDTQLGYDQTVANSKDTLKSIEVSLETSRTNYENAKKNKEITIKQQQAAIVDAQIALKEAQRNYNNLFIKSPITGTISDISVDLGQELNN
jgi:acetyl/propionyl-CoA carboxylase alpha subunit